MNTQMKDDAQFSLLNFYKFHFMLLHINLNQNGIHLFSGKFSPENRSNSKLSSYYESNNNNPQGLHSRKYNINLDPHCPKSVG
jgi:hypothetical protein